MPTNLVRLSVDIGLAEHRSAAGRVEIFCPRFQLEEAPVAYKELVDRPANQLTHDGVVNRGTVHDHTYNGNTIIFERGGLSHNSLMCGRIHLVDNRDHNSFHVRTDICERVVSSVVQSSR